MAQNDCDVQIKYIYDLPFLERAELCRLLNQANKWVELAGRYMNFNDLTIEQLKKHKNPTDELLTKWSHQNHTIVELFIALSRMQHYKSMLTLKPFVDRKYHVLIVHPVQIEDPKVVINQSDNEEGTKILNRQPEPNNGFIPSNSNNLLAPSSVPFPNAAPTLRPVISTTKIDNQLVFTSVDTTLPQVSYDELARATNGWSVHAILGKGGFGTVFRGTWKNTQVAIKRIEQRGSATNERHAIQLQQSLRELKILDSYRHDNILSLYAYSMGDDAPCLVYQFMPNGSLEDRLLLRRGTKPLSWLQRHEIAKGTARGLQFLHTIGDKPLIHGDIKSANILLDKNLEPRIGDFGLAREGAEKDYMKVSRIHGTRPYLPHEFLHDKILSTKIDTYSYGIVLFELATGLAAYDGGRPENKFLKDFMDSQEERNLLFLKDDKAGKENEQVYDNLIILGKWCSNRLSKDRPEMVLVLQKIDEL
ncbi:pelle-like serine/threonine-protein kinase pik-1 isoform X2 [Athalia rosae]|uniref:pelle-like serine/threonine-protein kinase pik-1 isoform X2 n=1 Tax=Athalia rosae TaxID=37344 RepID=UPI002033EB52|nr:pelle-like serine/threonine-protein kinase pik-1 isoform X2 [Athalia rosae]